MGWEHTQPGLSECVLDRWVAGRLTLIEVVCKATHFLFFVLAHFSYPEMLFPLSWEIPD